MARSLHNYLRRFRNDAGLLQKEVGRIVGEPRSSVAAHEWGSRLAPLETAIRYRILYDRPMRDLYRGLYESLEEETRTVAKRLFDELPQEERARSIAHLGKIAHPDDTVIVPTWEE